MSIAEPQNRYSVIKEKNPREIVLLRGSGCRWRKCTFCDYHLDFSVDKEANYALNSQALEKVTGCYGKLEVINSGSFCELDERTVEKICETCVKNDIGELHVEFHWLYRSQIPFYRACFAKKNVTLKVKMGVETFDAAYREKRLKKGIDTKEPMEIAAYADEICLLFGLGGQTKQSMQRDVLIGLRYFERVCINIMVENSTAVKPDKAVIQVFQEELYEVYADDPRVDILMENTDFGVGDRWERRGDKDGDYDAK